MNQAFTLKHVGISTENPEQAVELARLLSLMFKLNPQHAINPSSPVSSSST